MKTLGRQYSYKIIGIFLCSMGLLFAEGVNATVNTQEVVKGNVIELQLRATGGKMAFPRILSVGGYRTLGTSVSQQYSASFVNGQSKMQRTKIQTITFRPTADMTIPSYSVNISGTVYKTDPIKITVRTSSAPSVKKNTRFSLTMQTNKDKLIVGESLIVTVYFSLHKNVRLSQDVQYVTPKFKGFSVFKGKEKSAYMKGAYQVQEIEYILTAQEEGNQTATPAQVKVGLPTNAKQDVFGFSFGTTWEEAYSNTVNIEILPSTQESDLVGDFQLKNTIDTKKTKANTPVNMTITLEGEGSLDGLEIPKYEIENVTVYSDEASIESKNVNGVLHSTYSKHFVFISDEDFEIPTKVLIAYNPKTKQSYDLEIQGRKVTIAAMKTKGQEKTSLAKHQVQTDIKQSAKVEIQEVEKRVEVERISWWMLVLAFVLGMLLMYLFRFIPELKRKQKYSENEALQILYGHIGNDEEIEIMVRKLYARKNGDKTIKIDKESLGKMIEKVVI